MNTKTQSNQPEEFYHDRLKQKVTIVIAPNASGYVIVRIPNGKLVSTHESHLKPLVDMTGDEILRREG